MNDHRSMVMLIWLISVENFMVYFTKKKTSKVDIELGRFVKRFYSKLGILDLRAQSFRNLDFVRKIALFFLPPQAMEK